MTRPERFWDRMSKNYDKPDHIEQVKTWQSIQAASNYLSTSQVVLDLGCATGAVACAIADQVAQVHGIDISSKMIRIAQERAAEHNLTNVSFSKTSLCDPLFENNSFDAILAFNVLHLIKDTDEVLHRIHDLLKPGGYLISLTPCLDEKKIMRAFAGLVRVLRILPVLHGFKINQFNSIIQNTGFQIIENRCIDDEPLEYFIIAKSG